MKRIFPILCGFVLLLITGCSNTRDNLSFNSEIIDDNSSNAGNNEDIIIRIATDKEENTPSYLLDAIEEFNDLHNGYTVQPVIYAKEIMTSDETGGLQTSDMRLQLDIIQNCKVDIVMDSIFNESSRYDILSEKGAFCDLNAFLNDNSDEPSLALNTHILKIHETDNKLYQLPLYYSFETIVGRESYVGSKENWTLDELIAHWNEMPSGSFFCDQLNQWDVYWCLIRGNLGAYVDYENGTCSFDSPDFCRLLEFCKNFPPATIKNWDVDINTAYFLDSCSIRSFTDFHSVVNGFSSKDWEEEGPSNENRVFVGYPSNDESGSFINSNNYRFSICSKSSQDVQTGAWLFLNYMLSEEFQKKYSDNGFPLNESAFRSLANDQLVHYGEENVLEFSSFNVVKVDFGYLSEQEYEKCVSLINNTKQMNPPVDYTVQKIIEGELESVFSNEKTVTEVANAIQGRVEILISERM